MLPEGGEGEAEEATVSSRVSTRTKVNPVGRASPHAQISEYRLGLGTGTFGVSSPWLSLPPSVMLMP